MNPERDHHHRPDDGPLAVLLLLGLLGVGTWLAWTAFRPQIVGAVLSTQGALAGLAGLFTDRFDLLVRQLATADPVDPSITAGRLYRLAHDVGGFYRVPAALLLGALGVLCFRRAGATAFRRDFDLPGLMREQARTFRFTAPFASRSLRPVAPAPGAPRPLDPALHAPEWAARFARGPDGGFDGSAARRALAAQLGPLWEGPDRAAPHVRCLFAAFALHAARCRDEARDLLGDTAESLPHAPGEGAAGPSEALAFGSDVVARADAWLRHPHVARPCAKVAARHGFTAPALMTVLCHARERAGVLNPGMFAFLQFVDRPLFLACDALGFPVPGTPWHRGPAPMPATEAAGAREHWAAECEAGGPLRLPVVGAAAETVRAAAGDAGRSKGKRPAR